jgi:hypothetical protein
MGPDRGDGSAVCLALAIAVLASSATAILVARLWRVNEPPSGSAEHLFRRKAYQIAVVAEVLAIYTASAILPCFGWQAYFIQIVGIIVGLHFIGLWAATRSMRFLGISAGMCVISTAAIFLPPTTHLLNLRGIFTELGNAIVLWLGAGRSLETRT